MNGRFDVVEFDEEEIEADDREDRFGDDFAGAEPAQILAAVEHHLQRADAERQRQEAEPRERHVAADRALGHEGGEAEHGQDAERQVDEEHPAPRIILGQPAAEGRAHDRPEHHAHAPDRHRRAAPGRRIGVEHHRLAERHQRGAEHALQQAEGDHLLDALRDPAQHRGDGEAGGADDEQLLAADARRQPAERRGHDRRGDDIGGQHPVDLILGGRQRPLHVGQGDIGDRRVERLHDGRHHDADRQHGARQRRHVIGGLLVHGAAVLAADGETNQDSIQTKGEISSSPSERVRPVSIETFALMPARRPLGVLVGVEAEAQRHALHHLDPIAARVLRRQDRELRAGAGRDRADPALELAPGEGVDRHARRLAGVNVSEVRLLRIGVDPQAAVFDDGEHRPGPPARRGQARSGRPASPRRRSARRYGCGPDCARRRRAPPWPGYSQGKRRSSPSGPPPSLIVVVCCM